MFNCTKINRIEENTSMMTILEIQLDSIDLLNRLLLWTALKGFRVCDHFSNILNRKLEARTVSVRLGFYVKALFACHFLFLDYDLNTFTFQNCWQHKIYS